MAPPYPVSRAQVTQRLFCYDKTTLFINSRKAIIDDLSKELIPLSKELSKDISANLPINLLD